MTSTHGDSFLDRAQNWSLAKPSARSRGGVVCAQNAIAAEAGARVLRAGGNAVDAAIATSFAVSTVEPWMSGLGGGGFMLVWLAAEQRVRVIDFGMIAPRALDPADYPLAAGGAGGDLFQWPAVIEDRNVTGHLAMAVPTQVAGIALAHERFATKPWGELIAPAIALAEGGLPVTWFTTLRIAASAGELRRFKASSEIYLPDGLAPAASQGAAPPRRRLGNLAATLLRLAEAGPRDFYEGRIADQVLADIEAGGGRISAADLAACEAVERDPIELEHNGARIYAASGLTAGPTLVDAMARFADQPSTHDGAPTAETYAAWARALKAAYARRLATMGDGADDAGDPACTSHLTAIDGAGNMVSLTQTLLSAFGSKVVLPRTGILMNNGIMWFDPRPGRPNSIAAGKRPLSNMCPTIVRRPNGESFAIGASGGRRIMPAVLQLTSMMVDCGMDLTDAFHQPRIDVSGGETANVDIRLGRETIDAVAAVMPAVPVEDTVFPSNFACPCAVADGPAGGEKRGQCYPMFPMAGSVGA